MPLWSSAVFLSVHGSRTPHDWHCLNYWVTRSSVTNTLQFLVQKERFELSSPFGREGLNLLCIPFHHFCLKLCTPEWSRTTKTRGLSSLSMPIRVQGCYKNWSPMRESNSLNHRPKRCDQPMNQSEIKLWCYERASNSQPDAYKATALPTCAIVAIKLWFTCWDSNPRHIN